MKAKTLSIFLRRIAAVFLSVNLALPSTALALRQAELVESGLEGTLARALGRTSKPAAGLEGEWQNQMWEVLAEGFGIQTEDLRKRLQPTDLLDFRRSFGPEELGPKIDIYARILVGTDLSAQTRQRMIAQLAPLIEPPPVYPDAVVKSFEELSRAEITTEFDTRLAKFVSTIRTELPKLSPNDPVRVILEQLVDEEGFTLEQKKILRTVAKRIVKAFHPEFGNDRVETYAQRLLSNTHLASLRSFRSILPARISQLREKYRTKEDWPSAAIDNLLPGGAFFPESAQILLPPLKTQDHIALANVAAHEYGHALLLELENSDGQGQTRWRLERRQGESFSHADWITEGLAAVMDGWFSLDRGEAIPMPKTVTIWFHERAQQLVDEPEQAWIREWALLEGLPSPIRRYVQGVMAGEVAEAVGRKVASQQVDGNPYQVAANFLAWYAKQPMEQSVPRVEEMARAVQAFLTRPAAGLEGQLERELFEAAASTFEKGEVLSADQFRGRFNQQMSEQQRLGFANMVGDGFREFGVVEVPSRFYLHADTELARIGRAQVDLVPYEGVTFIVSEDLRDRPRTEEDFPGPGVIFWDTSLPGRFEWPESPLAVHGLTIREMAVLRPNAWIPLSINRNLTPKQVLRLRMMTVQDSDGRTFLVFA